MSVFCFKQKKAYEVRISGWSADVCSSDLFGIRSFSQHSAARQHGDCVGDGRHDVHVVFNHQDGATLANLLDQLGDAVDVFVAHALGGLVEQDWKSVV